MPELFNFAYFPRLETERLVLREITTGDVQAIYDLFSDPEVTRYNDVETIQQIDDAGWIVDFVQDRFTQRVGLRWAICLKEDESALIGTCGYNIWMRHNNCGEIGYDLMKRYWGQGITPEAVKAIIGFGFQQLGLNRVEADVTIGNEASVRVLQKLGFQEEGTLRQRGYWKGKYHDLRFFSLLREDF